MIICLYEVSLVVSLPPRGCVYILQTRPLFELAFFPRTCMSQRHISIVSRFFYRRNCSKFCRIHLKFSLPFKIPYLASIFYVFLLHLSGSTGSLRPLLDTGWYITSPG
jgi:hypothetical protein